MSSQNERQRLAVAGSYRHTPDFLCYIYSHLLVSNFFFIFIFFTYEHEKKREVRTDLRFARTKWQLINSHDTLQSSHAAARKFRIGHHVKLVA